MKKSRKNNKQSGEGSGNTKQSLLHSLLKNDKSVIEKKELNSLSLL